MPTLLAAPGGQVEWSMTEDAGFHKCLLAARNQAPSLRDGRRPATICCYVLEGSNPGRSLPCLVYSETAAESRDKKSWHALRVPGTIYSASFMYRSRRRLALAAGVGACPATSGAILAQSVARWEVGGGSCAACRARAHRPRPEQRAAGAARLDRAGAASRP